MKNKSLIQISRHLIQLISFILFPGFFILVLSSIEAIYKAVFTQAFTLTSLLLPIMVLVAIIPVTVFWGRFFCGYICAFGSMQELLNFVAKKLRFKQLDIDFKIDKYLKGIKYFIIVILIIIWTMQINIDKLSPWNVFGIYSSKEAWQDFGALFCLGGLLLVLIMFFSLFIERGFCRYLCPLGGIFALISKCRLYKIKKKSNKCVNCNLCTKKCPMNIDVNKQTKVFGRVEANECIDCFKCIDNCKPEALYTNPKEAMSITAATLTIAGVYCAGTLAINSEVLNNNQTTTFLEQGKYSDGVYEGTGKGYRGNISVTVEVDNGNIASIAIESYQDDEQFFNQAKNTIINEIISSQSVAVETVSGATYSSQGIIEAVANALNITDTADAENKQDNSSTAIDTFTNLSDGTYEGTGTGRNGEMIVSVVVANGKVISIELESSQEDMPYLNRAKDTIINEIITNQTIDVQTVSGATMSSNGIIEAVANALNITFTNPNDQIEQRGGRHQKHYRY